jgi:hypothetical protein
LFRTRADAVPDAYKRYPVNSLREMLQLPGAGAVDAAGEGQSV